MRHRLRPSCIPVLLAAVLVPAAEGAAQACGPAPSAQHGVSATYATAPFVGSDVPVRDGTASEVGPAYARVLRAPDLVGAGNAVTLEASLLQGRLSIRDVPNGAADAPYLRISGTGTVATAVGFGVHVCATVGLHSTQYTGRYAPTAVLDVPFGVGVAVAVPIGGLLFVPFVVPTVGYTSRYTEANPSWGRPSSAVVQGKDLALSAGTTLRFGRIELRGGVRLKEWRLDNQLQWQLRSTLWF